MSFTYQSGAVAAYPVGTTIIYSPGAIVDYVAGASVTYVYKTVINFGVDTEVYTQNGPVTFAAGSDGTFAAGSQVAYGPGSSVRYGTVGETRYGQFNGNTHAIAGYPQQTSVQYYYGPNGSNLILFAPGSNPLSYYNPGIYYTYLALLHCKYSTKTNYFANKLLISFRWKHTIRSICYSR